jgi:hypothetical protein
MRDSPEAPAIALNLFAISRDPRGRSSSTTRLRVRFRIALAIYYRLNEPRF